MYIAAFSLYAMIPGSDEIYQDLKVRIDQLNNRTGIKDGLNIIETARLKSSLEKIKKHQKEGTSHDAKVLLAMAYLHDQAGNQRGAYGVFDQLELYYKKNKNRESNLFNLVRVTSILGSIFETEKYGALFLKDFPASDKVEAVRRLMLSSLFFNREYKKSLTLSENMIGELTPGTEQHDICQFVLGGSYFYLGEYDKAQPELDKYVKEYPEGKFIMHAEYYQASNLTRQLKMDQAAKLLDAFLKKYPKPDENIYMANALFDRASCHFSANEYDQALAILDRLSSEFPESSVIEMAYNMKGNIQESSDKMEEAEKSYLAAFALAKKRGNRPVAAEALSYLVGMLCIEEGKKPNPRAKDAVPYYDLFMKEYSDSQFKPQVVVYGMPAMKAVGRSDEGLENLQKVIPELANSKRSAFLEESVNAYTKAFLEKKGNTPEKLKDLYYNFPGIDLKNQRVLALLRIAIISVYEEEREKAVAAKNEDAIRSYDSSIKVLFQDLKTEFNPADLTNYVLLKVADYLREKTSAPKQSVPYYEALLKRKDKFGVFKARLGIADVMGMSDDVSENKKAIRQLEEVYKLAKDEKTTRGKALFRLVEIYAKIADWDKVEEKARLYLSEKYSKKLGLVSYLYAKSFDERKKLEDALGNYSMVYSRYTGYIAISAPSVKRVMEILWERDLPAGAKVGEMTLKVGDRQNAYSGIGAKYIASTRRIRETNKKLTDSEAAAWDEVAALVKKYENSGLVKTLEQLKEERLKNRRGGR
jgi:tetratricopeptide (TPR) repeat protein